MCTLTIFFILQYLQFYSIFIINKSEHEYFHFISLIKLHAVFCVRQLNYCSGVPRANGMFSWGSTPAKRLKTTVIENACCPSAVVRKEPGKSGPVGKANINFDPTQLGIMKTQCWGRWNLSCTSSLSLELP